MFYEQIQNIFVKLLASNLGKCLKDNDNNGLAYVPLNVNND